jgi:hypothetical protein
MNGIVVRANHKNNQSKYLLLLCHFHSIGTIKAVVVFINVTRQCELLAKKGYWPIYLLAGDFLAGMKPAAILADIPPTKTPI